MQAKDILKRLESMAEPERKKGMARVGISTDSAYGIAVPKLREMAKEIGKNHDLALELWKTGNHEARMLAGFIGEPTRVTEKLMEQWVQDFDSWDICDQVVSNLFDRTPWAYAKAMEWSEREEEFVKRAGFAMMASLAVHDKKAPDAVFMGLFKFIAQATDDDRNFVKKAVNWALRGIGKRNLALNEMALANAYAIAEFPFKSAQWIAKDAIRELSSEAVQERLRKKAGL